MKRYLEAGRLNSPRGLKGEIRFECWCDDAEFLSGVSRLYLDSEGKRFLEVERYIPHLGTVVFKGYPDRTAVSELTGRTLLPGLTIRTASQTYHVLGIENIKAARSRLLPGDELF